jgi:hypothetical protein
MATLARKQDLAELVGELVDVELAGHSRDCEQASDGTSIQSRRAANTVCRLPPERAL